MIKCLLFFYSRPEFVKLQYEQLSPLVGALFSEIIVYVDYHEDLEIRRSVHCEVSHYFKNAVYRTKRLGLSENVINAINQETQKSEFLMIIEDDIVFKQDISQYVSFAIDEIKRNDKIAGASLFSPHTFLSTCYKSRRPSSWGWILNSAKWDSEYINNNQFYQNFKDRVLHNCNTWLLLGPGFIRMAKRKVKKLNDSWLVIWAYYSAQRKFYFIYPGTSLIQNMGTEISPTHGSIKPFPYLVDFKSRNIKLVLSHSKFQRFCAFIQHLRIFKLLVVLYKNYASIIFFRKQRK